MRLLFPARAAVSRFVLVFSMVAATLAPACSRPALAYLVVSLRLADGSTSVNAANYSPNDQVTLQVWATVVGTNTDFSDDGLSFLYFGIQSAGASGISGNLVGGSLIAPFNDSPGMVSNVGTFGDRNGDGVVDWRGAATNGFFAVTGWPKPAAGLTTMFPAGSTAGEAAGPTAWSFHVADAMFQFSEIDSGGSLTLEPMLPSPTVSSTRGVWREDGANKSGAIGTILVEPGVEFTAPDQDSVVLVGFNIQALPEPSSFALLGIGGLGLLIGYRRCRR